MSSDDGNKKGNLKPFYLGFTISHKTLDGISGERFLGFDTFEQVEAAQKLAFDTVLNAFDAKEPCLPGWSPEMPCIPFSTLRQMMRDNPDRSEDKKD